MGFFGLQVGFSALRAQQYAMDVTSHNIANANTEGYRRQQPVFIPGNPLLGAFTLNGIGIPQLGTGVLVQTVRRMQSDYIEGQIRMGAQELGTWSARNQALQQVETMLSELSDNSLSNLMDEFWNSWQELAASPESFPARLAVVEAASSLSDRIRTLYHDLRSLQRETDQTIISEVKRVNQIAHEIASLNEQITRSLAGGYQPNDLLDRRDMLIEELSQIARIQVHGAGGADCIISIGGKALVQGNMVTELSTVEGPNGWSQIAWTDNSSPATIPGGELKGLLDIRDTVLEGYILKLNDLTQTLVSNVNAVHNTGYDLNGNNAGDFFVPGSDASNIAVDPTILASPSLVAASGNGAPGDNTCARTMADLRNVPLLNGQTIDSAYGTFVALIGSDVREARTRAAVHELSLKQLKNQRESISGVSLDEEMVNMLKFQQAYNAAARIITVVDEMISTLINQTGIVGR